MKEKLTIFTPTYNRAYTIEQLYKSLKNQTCYDFEWLIIDDDSADNTEELIKNWINKENKFEIRYYKQKHGGKHRAINRAIELAKGQFFFIVDSDDFLTNNAVELVNKWCTLICNEEKIAGVAGLREDKNGQIIGGKIEFDKNTYVDATNFERIKLNLVGDKAEIYKTEILKKYKFPEFEGEYFVTEDVCWMSIAYDGYKIRWYNQPIYICEYLDDGLTKSGANDYEGHRKNYKGYCYYISKCLVVKPFIEKMLHIKEYNDTQKKISNSLLKRAHDIDKSIFVYILYIYIGIPLGYVLRKLSYKKVK